MKTYYSQLNIIVFIFALIVMPSMKQWSAGFLYAQNVGINTAGASPNISAILDIDAQPAFNKGLLIPRVTYSQRIGANFNPLSAAAQGLTVYQTDAGGLGEGFYYNTSTSTTPAWSFLLNNTSGWSLTGNTATTPSTSAIGTAIAAGQNYVGTSDLKDFVLATNNLERMRITANGNVGIGATTTSSTYGKLTVAGTGIHINDDGNAKLEIGRYSSGSPNSYLKLGANSSALMVTNAADNTDLFTILNTGNVGIGTTSPQSPLHIYTPTIAAGTKVTALRLGSLYADGLAKNAITFWGSTDTDKMSEVVNGWDGSGSYLGIHTRGTLGGNADNNTTEKMRVTSAGNVGIGTTSPGVLLDVNGTIRSRNGAFQLNDGSTTGGGLYFQKTITGSGSSLEPTVFAEGATGKIYFATGGSATTKMIIDQNGNIGIGTTAPSTQLHTTGGVRFQTLTGTGNRFVITDLNGNISAGAATTAGIVTGSGTLNYVPKWTPNGNTLDNSSIFDNGTNVGIGTIAPSSKLDVRGTLTVSNSSAQYVRIGNTYNNPVLTVTDGSTLNSPPGYLNGGYGYYSMGISANSFFNPGSGVWSNPVITTSPSWAAFITSCGDACSFPGDNFTIRRAPPVSGAPVWSDFFTINAAGNVGIGTTVPAYKLSISGTGAVRNEIIGTDAGSTAGIYLRSNGNGGGATIRDNNKDLEFFTSTAGQVVTIKDGGNVGIGTTSPTLGKLNVVSAANTSVSALRIESSGTLANNDIVRMQINGLTNGFRMFQDGSSNVIYSFQDGNVGIGTTSPGAKLEIAGQIKITGGSPGINKVLTSDATGLASWQNSGGTPFSGSVTSGNWYRIASNPGNRCNAEFTLRDFISGGGHSTATFRVGTSYNYASGTSFTLLNHNQYGGATFTKVRVLQATTYDPQYLEVYVERTGSVEFSVYDNLQANGWVPLAWTAGGIPGGYTDREFNIDNLFVVGDSDDRLTINRGGNVGIGTTSPGSKLDVAGQIRIRNGNGIAFERDLGQSDYSTFVDAYGFPSQGYGAGGAANYWVRLASKGGTHIVLNTDGGAGSGENSFDHFTVWQGAVDGDKLFNVSNIGNTYIKGNLGIGTTSPGAKLEIAGQIKITGGSPGINKVLTSDATGLASWQNSGGTPFSGSVTSGNWYRIASNPGNRCNAEFTLRDFISGGGHSTATFRVGTSYNYASGTSFTLLNHNQYGGATFTKVRVLQATTYDPQYLEVYVERTGSVEFSVYDNLQANGWVPVAWTAGGIPGGYTDREFNIDNLFVVGDSDDRLTINRGGNVGIGTTSPNVRLHLASNSFLGVPTAYGNIPGSYSRGSSGIILAGSQNSDGSGWAYGARTVLVDYGDGLNYEVDNLFSGTWNNSGFVVSGRSGKIGNVGIGTTSPTKKLQVTGGSLLSTSILTDGYVQDVSGIVQGNYIPSQNWNIASGSVGIFNDNGGAGDNTREWGDGPDGNRAILWKGFGSGTDADGGWNTSVFDIDHTKSYRVSVWVKKTGVNSGTTYLGIQGSNVTYLNGVAEGNPYFFCGTPPKLDQWYLIVGYIHGSGDASLVGSGGLYDGSTGLKVINFGGLGNCGADYKFTTAATTQQQRAYLYYNNNSSARQYFFNPRFEEVNGKEIPIAALLGAPVMWQEFSTPLIKEFSFSGSGSQTITLPSSVPTNARYVLADIFVTANFSDHQNFVLGRSSLGAEKNWVDSRGQQPSSQFGNLARHSVTLSYFGEADGYSSNYGIWYSSQLVPVSGQTMYYQNYGNSGSTGWLYMVIRSYSN